MKSETSLVDWSNQTVRFFSPRSFLRLFLVRVAFAFVTLAMGISFFVAGTGVTSLLLRLAPYWRPAYSLLTWVTGEGDPAHFVPPPPLPWWHVALLGLRVALCAIMIGAGIWIFVRMGGFCGQNLICAMSRN